MLYNSQSIIYNPDTAAAAHHLASEQSKSNGMEWTQTKVQQCKTHIVQYQDNYWFPTETVCVSSRLPAK